MHVKCAHRILAKLGIGLELELIIRERHSPFGLTPISTWLTPKPHKNEALISTYTHSNILMKAANIYRTLYLEYQYYTVLKKILLYLVFIILKGKYGPINEVFVVYKYIWLIPCFIYLFDKSMQYTSIFIWFAYK